MHRNIPLLHGWRTDQGPREGIFGYHYDAEPIFAFSALKYVCLNELVVLIGSLEAASCHTFRFGSGWNRPRSGFEPRERIRSGSHPPEKTEPDPTLEKELNPDHLRKKWIRIHGSVTQGSNNLSCQT